MIKKIMSENKAQELLEDLDSLVRGGVATNGTKIFYEYLVKELEK